MIAFIEGEIVELTPTNVVLLTSGIGYDISITLTDYSKLRDLKHVRLFITEIIREDAYLLYGFLDIHAKSFFDKLRSVSGVGPSTARLVLSSFVPSELATIINNGSIELIQSVKGIGLKTAQRIVVDLKGKLILPDDEFSNSLEEENSASIGVHSQEIMIDAQNALKNLGYAEANVKKIVRKLLSDNPAYSIEEVIRKALKLL